MARGDGPEDRLTWERCLAGMGQAPLLYGWSINGMRRVVQGTAEAFGAAAELDFRVIFAPTVNDAKEAEFAASRAAMQASRTRMTSTADPWRREMNRLRVVVLMVWRRRRPRLQN